MPVEIRERTVYDVIVTETGQMVGSCADRDDAVEQQKRYQEILEERPDALHEVS